MHSRTWRSGIDWDETIEADAHKKWLKWVNDIIKKASIRRPRCISPGHTEGSRHQESSRRSLESHIDPSLELQAALLALDYLSIPTEIELNVTRKIFWTDSRTVLSWIRSDPRSFKPFVAHRLAELEETRR
ncbi:hypothetical protein EVAR_57023_1 [Eumeta japonica]|uniref:Uncharacterized protein n=1 Tax=Eumeta variegata TaxID=151549 RepID=A0A4C2A691_EUMVA|nr:hypothetical protein EVAR_57023_1 [Eumeta japonica]